MPARYRPIMSEAAGYPVARDWQDDRVLPRRLTRLAGCVLLALLTLVTVSGCVRVQVGLAVSEDDLVSGEVIIAALPTKPGDPGPTLNIVPELQGKVRLEKYAADNYVGQKMILTDLRFSDVTVLVESITEGKQYRLSFRRSGDLVSMAGSIDLTQLPKENNDVQIKIAFPGQINRNNGLNENGTIVWKPKPGAVTEFGVTAQYSDNSGVSWTKWVAIVGGSAVGVALIVLALALFGHRRTRKQLAEEQSGQAGLAAMQ
jgi:hypothetical protein